MRVLEDNFTCFQLITLLKDTLRSQSVLPHPLLQSCWSVPHSLFILGICKSFLLFVEITSSLLWPPNPSCPPLTCLTPVYPSGLSPGRFLWLHLLPTPGQHSESPVPFHRALCLPSTPLAGSQSTRKFLRTKLSQSVFNVQGLEQYHLALNPGLLLGLRLFVPSHTNCISLWDKLIVSTFEGSVRVR